MAEFVYGRNFIEPGENENWTRWLCSLVQQHPNPQHSQSLLVRSISRVAQIITVRQSVDTPELFMLGRATAPKLQLTTSWQSGIWLTRTTRSWPIIYWATESWSRTSQWEGGDRSLRELPAADEGTWQQYNHFLWCRHNEGCPHSRSLAYGNGLHSPPTDWHVCPVGQCFYTNLWYLRARSWAENGSCDWQYHVHLRNSLSVVGEMLYSPSKEKIKHIGFCISDLSRADFMLMSILQTYNEKPSASMIT